MMAITRDDLLSRAWAPWAYIEVEDPDLRQLVSEVESRGVLSVDETVFSDGTVRPLGAGLTPRRLEAAKVSAKAWGEIPRGLPKVIRPSWGVVMVFRDGRRLGLPGRDGFDRDRARIALVEPWGVLVRVKKPFCLRGRHFRTIGENVWCPAEDAVDLYLRDRVNFTRTFSGVTVPPAREGR